MKFAERIDLSLIRFLLLSCAEAFGVGGESNCVAPSSELSSEAKWMRRERLTVLTVLTGLFVWLLEAWRNIELAPERDTR
jgi:hypothetical protein